MFACWGFPHDPCISAWKFDLNFMRSKWYVITLAKKTSYQGFTIGIWIRLLFWYFKAQSKSKFRESLVSDHPTKEMSIQTCWLFVAQPIAFCQKCCEFLLLKPGGVLASNETQDQWLFLYTTYILCSGGVICYLPPFMIPRNNHWQEMVLTRGFSFYCQALFVHVSLSAGTQEYNARSNRKFWCLYIHVQLYFNVHMYKPQMPLKISWSSNSSIKNVLLFDDLNESNTNTSLPFFIRHTPHILVPKIHSSESSVSWKKNNTKSMVVQCLTQAFRYHSSMRLKCAAASSAEPLLPCRNLERPNDDVATSSSRHRVGSVGCSLEIRWLFDDCGRRSPANSNSTHHQTWPTWKSQRQKMNRRHDINQPKLP